MLSVYVIVVNIGIVVDPPPGFFDHLSPGSEHQGFGRAFGNTGGHKAFLKPVKAHVAFPDFRIGAVIFEFRNIKRAGNHAITAPHAFIAPPDHRPGMGFMHGIRQAGRSTGRRVAMHALLLDVNFSFRRVVQIDHILLCFARLADDPRFRRIGGLRKVVRRRTGILAALASDTAAGIVKHPHEFFRRRIFCCLCCGGIQFFPGGQRYACNPQYLEKISSVNWHNGCNIMMKLYYLPVITLLCQGKMSGNLPKPPARNRPGHDLSNVLHPAKQHTAIQDGLL